MTLVNAAAGTPADPATLVDVDALVADIKNAEARGYKPGRRERTQLDDATKMRAATVRRTSGTPPSR
jgi:hypothetical protein